jgi:hypothetical protein
LMSLPSSFLILSTLSCSNSSSKSHSASSTLHSRQHPLNLSIPFLRVFFGPPVPTSYR